VESGRVARILRHLFKTKGILRAAERGGQIVRRFAFGKRRFDAMIGALERDIPCPPVRITFCVTARLLKERVALIKRLQVLGHEFAAHGYFHTDMTRATRAEQDAILNESYAVFREADIPVAGFRCPYLSYNLDTTDALVASPFVYSSNDVVLWKDTVYPYLRDNNFLNRLWNLYHILPAEHTPSRPRMLDGLVEIPLTGPDDEMLFDRCRVRNSEGLAQVWAEVLDRCHARGDLFHLMFHPERFAYVREAIVRLIQRAGAKPEPVWFCSLAELAHWWQQRAQARWVFERGPSGAYLAWIRLPAGGTVVRRSAGDDSTSAVYRDYTEAAPIDRRGDAVAFFGGRSRKEMIGLSSRCDSRLAAFLLEEGFPVERSEQPDLYSYYLDGYESFRDDDKVPLLEQIEKCSHAILRLWRWPSRACSAFTISSDVDSIALGDFIQRAAHF